MLPVECTYPLTGQTLLHLACKHKAYTWIKALIKQGASVHAVDHDIRTPLAYLFQRNRSYYETHPVGVDNTPLSKVCSFGVYWSLHLSLFPRYCWPSGLTCLAVACVSPCTYYVNSFYTTIRLYSITVGKWSIYRWISSLFSSICICTPCSDPTLIRYRNETRNTRICDALTSVSCVLCFVYVCVCVCSVSTMVLTFFIVSCRFLFTNDCGGPIWWSDVVARCGGPRKLWWPDFFTS
jgi:hypothetical protein